MLDNFPINREICLQYSKDDIQTKICQNVSKMLKKVLFWGQNDEIGPKWWKVLGKMFVNNLLSIMNNHHSFMG